MGKEKVVIDGKESEEYKSTESLEFSSSGNRYGFIALKENGKDVVIIDGNESKEYDKIAKVMYGLLLTHKLSWSSDDKFSAFVGRIEGAGESDMCG